jgi:CRISPR-associated endonuclease/helicase Cas3
LVATSIVEAGMDYSFRVGFREWNSLPSIVNTGGRINRNCEYGRTCMLYVFDVVKNEQSSFTEHSIFRGRGDLAKKMVSRRMKRNKKSFFRITDRDLVKYFEEYTLGGVPAEKDKFVKLERATEFKSINEDFNVISNDGTVRALLNRDMFEAIENGEKINWKEFEKLSVRIYRSKRMKMFLEESKIVEYLWYYSGKYDDFLGYYAQFYGCDDSDFTDFI